MHMMVPMSGVEGTQLCAHSSNQFLFSVHCNAQCTHRESQSLIEAQWALKYNTSEIEREREIESYEEKAQADRKIEFPFFLRFTNASAEIKYLTDISPLLLLGFSAALTLVDFFLDTIEKVLTLMRSGTIPRPLRSNAFCQVTVSSRLEWYYISTSLVQRQVDAHKESFLHFDCWCVSVRDRRDFPKRGGIQALIPCSPSQLDCRTEDPSALMYFSLGCKLRA